MIEGLLTAFLGWAGGRGGAWWKRSWVRDYGISAVCCASLYIHGIHSWWLLLVFALTVGALSTYWDKLFGWDNYFFHGLMIGIASMPIAAVTGNTTLVVVRAIILCICIGLWSGIFKNVHVEESGRYSFVGFTLPILWTSA